MPPPTGVGPPPAANLKLKLQLIDKDQDTPSKLIVFETIFKKLNCQLTKLIPIQSGFIAITDSANSRDLLTSTRGISELKNINLIPTESREQQANKTLFVKRVDSVAGSHTPDEIKTELQKNHPWLEIVNIFKIKQYTHIFKIVCLTTAIADKVLENGLLLYYTRIAPSQITREKFTPIKTCFKCYRVNDHDTANCTATQIKCSNCSQAGHTHTQCTTTEKTCLNCPPPNNKHSTMYHSCPYRQQQQKISEQQKQQKTVAQTQATYKNIVKTTLEETKSQTQHLTLTSDIHLRLVACIIEAHVAAFFKTGQYHNILSDNLKKNFDLDMTFSPRNQSELLNLNNIISSNLPDPNAINTPTPAPQLPPKPARESRKRDSSLPNTEKDTGEWTTVGHTKHRTHSDNANTKTNKRKLHTSPLQLKSTELQICKSNTDTTPTPQDPPQKWFVEQFKKGHFKFIVKHDRYEEICKALTQENPPFQFNTNSIKYIRDSDFNILDNITGMPATTTHQGKRQHK